MKRLVSNLISHPLFSGSATMIVGTNIANAIAYLYHLILGRMLGPTSYGKLAAIFSIIMLITSMFSFLSFVIVKFVSSSEKKHLSYIYKWFNKKIFVIGVLLGLLTITFSSKISAFLHISTNSIVVLGPVMFLSLFVLFYRSFLQGMLKFKEIVITSNLDLLGRLSLGMLLVFMGWSYFGAVVGMAISSFIIVIVLKNIINKNIGNITENKIKKINSKKIATYAAPLFFSTVATNSFFTSDMLLVKHFFGDFDAGMYASLSTLGKIIFFGASPVSAVMFPLISKRHSKKQGYNKIFFLSLLMVFGISLSIVAVYFMFPELMIRMLFGEKYLSASKYLGLFGVFMMIYTLSFLMVNYFMSIEKTKVSIIALIFALSQIVGIWFFHESIMMVMNISIASSSLLFGSLLIYFGYEKRKVQ